VEPVSSIGSGHSIIGKIIGHGALTIWGHVEGELHASTVVIAEGGKPDNSESQCRGSAMFKNFKGGAASVRHRWRAMFSQRK
jgi:hypothetical protein